MPPPFGSGYYELQGGNGRWSVLQLCRPLSGAVTDVAQNDFRPVFAGFNCAAPFRERLRGYADGAAAGKGVLQLCRPLSGAVSHLHHRLHHRQERAFNRAAPFRERLVRYYGLPGTLCPPSIVPPPFGSG